METSPELTETESKKEKTCHYLVSSNQLRKKDNYFIYDMSLDNIFSFKIDWIEFGRNIKNINAFNNRFKIDETEIVIQYGTYTKNQLISTINKLFTELSIDCKIEWVETTNKVKFISSKKFKLNFTSKINYNLGFKNTVYSNNNQYISEDAPKIVISKLCLVNENQEFNNIHYKPFDCMEIYDYTNDSICQKFTKENIMKKQTGLDIVRFAFNVLYVLENEQIENAKNLYDLDINDYPLFYLYFTFKN